MYQKIERGTRWNNEGNYVKKNVERMNFIRWSQYFKKLSTVM